MKKTNPRAFTLIEIIACMGIFAIGFAAIAMMLPAGTVMQRDIEARGLGDIIGRNSLEVVKAKGIQALTYDYKGTDYMTVGLDDRIWGNLTAASPTRDLDWALFFTSWGQMWGDWHLGSSAAYSEMKPYFDTNNSGSFVGYTGYGYHPNDGGDCTNFGMGRIHAFKERPIPGVTLGRTSLLDFSYPSCVLDITARTYFSNILRTNQSMAPVTNGDQAYGTSDPATQAWTLTAVTLKREGGSEWPEQVEFDTSQPAGAYFVGAITTAPNAPPTWCCSNTPVDFRSAGGDPAIAGKPDPGPNYLFPTFNSGSAQSQGTVPATGGSPGSGVTNGWMQGWCNDWDMGSWFRMYNSPGWDLGFSQWMALPVRENTASQYNYYPAPGTYRYPLPNLLTVPAIVYDRDNDLLLLRYPLCYARTLVSTGKNETSDTRVNNYRTAMGITSTGAGWVDRRLKVGDRFMTSRGSYAFTVKELLDPVAAAAVAPGTGAVNWSDGTYQIVRVSPSLRTTYFTANKPVGWGPSHWQDPQPRRLIVSPPPSSGGPSPWASTVQLIDGGTPSQNGAVFRQWDSLAE